MSISRALCLAIFCLLLTTGSGSGKTAMAAQSPLSGNFVFSFVNDYQGRNLGNGSYTVSYSFPSAATLGSNLTGQVSLQINRLNGLQLYVELYQITAQITTSTGGASGMVSGGSPLYPGAIWGPKNVTVPITQRDFGISHSVNASVNIIVATTLLAQVVSGGGGPVTEEVEVGDSQVVGNVTLATGPGSAGPNGGNSVPGPGPIPYIIVGAGVVVVFVGVLFPRIFPEKPGQKA